MAAVVQIEIDHGDHAGELIDALARRGLTGRSVLGDDWREVRISYEREQTERLLGDVTEVLEAWLCDRGLDSIRVRADGRLHVIRPRDAVCVAGSTPGGEALLVAAQAA